MARSLPAIAGSIALLLALAGCAKYDADAGNSANTDAAANMQSAPLAPGDLTPIVDNGAERRAVKKEAAASASPKSALPANDAPASRASDRQPPEPTSQSIAYRANGTEPFWAITVRDGIAALTRPDRKPIALPVTRTDDPRAIRYMGEGLTMVLTPGPCSDGMSDALYADRVQIAFTEGTLKGCGGPRIDEPERFRD